MHQQEDDMTSETWETRGAGRQRGSPECPRCPQLSILVAVALGANVECSQFTTNKDGASGIR